MTKKNQSAKSAKIAPKTSAVRERDQMFDALLSTIRAATSSIDARQELLVKVAGAVASGLVASPSPSISSAASMATAALDIAEQILTQAGIVATETSTPEQAAS